MFIGAPLFRDGSGERSHHSANPSGRERSVRPFIIPQGLP